MDRARNVTDNNTSFYGFCVMFTTWLNQTYGSIDRYPERLDENVILRFVNYSNDVIELWNQQSTRDQVPTRRTA